MPKRERERAPTLYRPFERPHIAGAVFATFLRVANTLLGNKSCLQSHLQRFGGVFATLPHTTNGPADWPRDLRLPELIPKRPTIFDKKNQYFWYFGQRAAKMAHLHN
jgi:hypothetical protein